MNERILVIEDEKSIARAIAYALSKEGYIPQVVYDGKEAIDKISEFQPHAVILDIMLPSMDGYEVLKKIGNKGSMGVIMLTAKEDIVNKVLGLELGADDYMTKPFDMRELLARLKSLLRRMDPLIDNEDKEEKKLGGVVLNLTKRTVYAGEKLLDMTPKEYELLFLLVSSPERVYSRDKLLDLVWGMEYIGGTRTVDIHIQRIRKKIGPKYNSIIQTLHGVGYKASGGQG